MCGIFALLNNYTSIPRNYLYKQFQKGQHRGPENSVMEEVMVKASFGFHRLAINGIDDNYLKKKTKSKVKIFFQ